MTARRSISLDKAAEQIDCSRDVIRRLLETGELRGHYVNRSVRVFADSLEAYQDAHAYRPKPMRQEQRQEAKRRPREQQVRAEGRLRALGVDL